MGLKEELGEALVDTRKAASQVCWKSVMDPLHKLMSLVDRALKEGIEVPAAPVEEVNRSSRQRSLKNRREEHA